MSTYRPERVLEPIYKNSYIKKDIHINSLFLEGWGGPSDDREHSLFFCFNSSLYQSYIGKLSRACFQVH